MYLIQEAELSLIQRSEILLYLNAPNLSCTPYAFVYKFCMPPSREGYFSPNSCNCFYSGVNQNIDSITLYLSIYRLTIQPQQYHRCQLKYATSPGICSNELVMTIYTELTSVMIILFVVSRFRHPNLIILMGYCEMCIYICITDPCIIFMPTRYLQVTH